MDLPEEVPNISGICMQELEEQFRKLKLDIKNRGHSVTGWNKARWIVQDKQKFEELISQLAYFTTKLREVLPRTSEQTQAANVVTTTDLEQAQDLKRLKLLLEASSGHHQSISESTQKAIDLQCQNRIIQTLWFRTMDDRRIGITPPHQKTVQWVLKEGIDRPWDSLHQWLAVGSGIYWVSGKAGSGKSTLMKFLHSHSTTKRLLSSWAGEHCNIGDFFFTYRGSPEQNTQQGLSRALLYHIIVTCPELIRKVLPWMWKEANNGSEVLNPPSQAEIAQAFEFISDYSDLPHFCFFIDGLDEYVGDIRQGVVFISDLARNPRTKFVVSSRPIPQCIARFKTHPQLALQDLNRGDITAYVQDVIGNHDYMKKLLGSDPFQSRKIMDDLVHKSSGVFLWVVLASRSLLDGFEAFDRITELQHRVDELPPELDDMFQLMLSRIDRRNREQGARLLRICYAARKSRPGADAYDGMFALGLAFLSDYFDMGADPFQSKRLNEIYDICDKFDGRLRSRCGGLLEMTGDREALREFGLKTCLCGPPRTSTKKYQWESEVYIPRDVQFNTWLDAKVSFMHRTVFEFLDKDGVWELDCLKLSTPQFHDGTAMSLYFLRLAVLSEVHKAKGDRAVVAYVPFLSFVHDGLEWIAEVEKTSSESSTPAHPNPHQSQTLVELWGKFLHRYYWHSYHRHRVPTQSQTYEGPFPREALVVAIEAEAVNFVRAHPDLAAFVKEPGPPHCPELLLDFAVERFSIRGDTLALSTDLTTFVSTFCTSSMVKELLDFGKDLDDAASGVTPWSAWSSSNPLRSSLSLETLGVTRADFRAWEEILIFLFGLRGFLSPFYLLTPRRDSSDLI